LDPEIKASDTNEHTFESLAKSFERQVAKTPSAIACIEGNRTITYAELNEQANQLSLYLRESGVHPRTAVGLCVSRSIEAIIGIMGIIKSDGIIVPLDPSLPLVRLQHIISEAQVALVLSSQQTKMILSDIMESLIILDDLPQHVKMYPTDNLSYNSMQHDIGYIMYTSGSTGTPKGILIEQGSITNLVLNQPYITLTSEHSIMHLANLGFDTALFEIWGALLNGAKLVIIEQINLLDFEIFKDILSSHNKTCCFINTFLFERMIKDDPGFFRGCETVLFGGEACHSKIIKGYISQSEVSNLPKNLIHVYGVTECTTFTSFYKIPHTDNHETIPIGIPLDHVSVTVLDEKLKPVSKGKVGEIYVGGKGLARGYVNAPELTQQSFIEKSGERLYKTGDRAKKLADGLLEYQGRVDSQIKISGYRAEPAEVERCLEEIPDVEKAFVVLEINHHEEKELTAYLTLSKNSIRMFYNGPCQIKWEDEQIESVKVMDLSQGGISISGINRRTIYRENVSIILKDISGKAELKGEVIWQANKVLGVHFLEGNPKISQYIEKSYKETHEVIEQHRNFKAILEKKLPYYMVPMKYIVLSSFPVLKNGQIDRNELQKIYELQKGKYSVISPKEEAQSLSAEILMQLWREVLSVPNIGRGESFLDKSEQPLLLTKILIKLKKYYHATISFHDFFSNPMVSQLATLIGNELEKSQYEPILPILRNQHIRLSYAQEGIWALENDKHRAKNSQFNIPVIIELKGALTISALQKAFEQLEQRHSILRTVYTLDSKGKPYQHEVKDQRVQLKVINLSSTDKVDKDVIQGLVLEESKLRFSLNRGPLYRVVVIELTEDKKIILMTFHRSIFDKSSISILGADLSELYTANVEGREASLPHLPIQYLDYSVWQRSELSHDKPYYQKLIHYWKNRLEGAPLLLSLPLDFSRPQDLNWSAGTKHFTIDKKLFSSLKGLSTNARCTLYMTLFGAFYSFLYQLSGINDIVIGALFANRNRNEIENLIGLFNNPLPIRVVASDTTSYSKLLEDVKTIFLEAYEHQDLPFECLVKEYGLDKKLNIHPLFQAMFIYQDLQSPECIFNRSQVDRLEDIELPFTPFDIMMNLEEAAEEILGTIRYSSELFKEETIERWIKEWIYLLQVICSNHQVKLSELGKK
jgi:amino acid adenylation domain-containing protein